MAYTQADLADTGCGVPGCFHNHSELFLHPACHLHGGIEAVYIKARGVLQIRCKKCHGIVGEFQIQA